MKIKDGFILREVAGQWLVVPLGERVVEFNGMITLSESGALIWKALENEASADDLVAKILAEYDIDEATAKTDVDEFLAMMKEKDLLA
ncbi:MAG: PqqD family protein [Candidatus Saccharibacteria bacterium]